MRTTSGYEKNENVMGTKSENPPITYRKITILINSVEYFLDTVFILNTGNVYRLIVIQKKKRLRDLEYKMLKSAKIAFPKIYPHKLFGSDFKPKWSYEYSPSGDWLDDKLSLPMCE